VNKATKKWLGGITCGCLVVIGCACCSLTTLILSSADARGEYCIAVDDPFGICKY